MHCWHLIVRREFKAREAINYGLSNAPAATSRLRLAQKQGQCYWIERTFQDGESQAGLDHDQARGWRSWHHHLAPVMMAMLSMLEERTASRDTYSLLSCADVETLLAHVPPRRDVDLEEVARQLEVRHQRRQSSVDAAHAKQQLE